MTLSTKTPSTNRLTTIDCDFDELIDRRVTGCGKWSRYDDDVLPLWVADMDFRSPQPIIDALMERVKHGVFGYGADSEPLYEAICNRLWEQYDFKVSPDQLFLLPGLVTGLNLMCKAIGEPGSGVLVNTPVYPPFLGAPANQDRTLLTADLAVTCRPTESGTVLRYEIDFDALEDAVTPETRLFLLCNPHNPVGREFTPQEQERLAEFCLRHDLIICSDEIHCELLLDGTVHTPIASLSPEVADRTVMLIAPSKTFNMPGLGCSAAVIQNPELRAQFEQTANRLVPHVNIMGIVAATAAYTMCDDWLASLCCYLTDNRDYVVRYILEEMPQIPVTVPEATYLAWLDCNHCGIQGNPQEFFLNEARVALNDGGAFGKAGEGFVRLNFGCPRTTLERALDRMKSALEKVS